MTATVPAQVVVGLDVGTTGVKAVAFRMPALGTGAPWRRMAIREYPLLQPEPGWAVQDPDTIVAAVAAALAECVAATGQAEVLAVSVSTAMHGLIALDADLRPLTPLVTWADARARDEARSLRHSRAGAELHTLTGAPVHPMTPLTKLMWFARHDPATWAAARWWVGLKEYILLWLTGRLVTELSSASGTGLLDMSTRAWHPAAIELCGVSVDRLPGVVATTTILSLAPATARQVDLPVGTAVVVGAADGPLGNLGTGAMTPGVAGLSLGTSGAVRMALGAPYVDSGRTLFCYALTDTVWVVGGAISNGGAVVRWAGHSLAPDLHGTGGAAADEALLQLAAAVPAGSDGLVMVPYLLAERAPLWDPDLPGAYLGLRQGHTRGHLIRAAVEGVCLQMRIILDRLDEVEPVSSVRVTGGVFRSQLWRQVMAAMLGRPLSVVGDAEGTALGAAALGLFALGHASHLTDAVVLLTDADVPPPLVDADGELVATYDRLRASVVGLTHDLDRVATLFQ
jgi:gluconokinase